MWTVVGVVLVVAILYFAIAGNRQQPRAPRSRSQVSESTARLAEDTSSIALFNEHKAWLLTRWADADRQRAAGALTTFPSWFFDAATDRQIAHLAERGLSLAGGPVSKGQASDVIGLFFPPDDGDEEFLKFFKVPSKGMNQTMARAEAAKLRADPAKTAAWAQRPAEPLQKEFYRFFGLKVPSGLNISDAATFIASHQKSLDDRQRDDWEAYESIVDDLSDKETCEAYNIKKPSPATLRMAIEALRKVGRSLPDLSGDLDVVAEKLIELKPELQRK